MSPAIRVLLVVALALMAFLGVLGSAYAQTGTGTATAVATMGAATTGSAAAATGVATRTATPATLPTTGGSAINTTTVVLLALGATAGLGGLLLRGLRQAR